MNSKTKSVHRTSPDQDDSGWPKGIKYIVGNEGCERFSFYGMRAILVVYLVMLYKQTGLDEKMAGNDATTVYHLFIAATYGFGLIGAVLAEKLFGKYRTIFWLSIVYVAGHGALAIFEDSLQGTFLGLGLIAVGSGGIKPCVSAHVGDQFGRSNWFRIQRVYQLFYFIINFGSFFSTLMIPWTRVTFGYSVAFAIPGILMAIATVFFWAGRHVFIHVQPNPGGKLGLLDFAIGTLLSASLLVPLLLWKYVPPLWLGLIPLACLATGLSLFFTRQKIEQDDGFLAVLLTSLGGLFKKHEDSGDDASLPAATAKGEDGSLKPETRYRDHWFFSAAARKFGEQAAEGPAAVFRIALIFLFVSVFWALFDQHGSSWVLQAKMMNREMFGITVLPDQISALNPLMVMLLIPIAGFILYPTMDKMGFKSTPLRRMTVGMFLASGAFIATALIQAAIADDVVITEGLAMYPYAAVLPEPTVSVGWQVIPYLILTLAEVMVSITGLEFAYTQAPRRMKSIIQSFWLLSVSFGSILVVLVVSRFPKMSLTNFFWVFAGLMAAAGVGFAVVSAVFYKYKDYTQE